jgi:hypothetical protein
VMSHSGEPLLQTLSHPRCNWTQTSFKQRRQWQGQPFRLPPRILLLYGSVRERSFSQL